MNRTARHTAVVCAVLLGLSLAAVAPAYINHDAAWYLFMSRRWLDGARLYQDVVDTNPPLIVWLSTPPVAVSHVLGLAAPALFKAWVFLVAAAALRASWRTIRAQSPALEFPLTCALVFLSLPFVKGDFGQREHFAVLLTLPYVMMATSPSVLAGRWLTVAIGVAGGLGFVIKPHFLLAWIAVEGAAIVRFRAGLRRALPIAAAITMGVYALAVLTLTPAYLTVVQQVREVYGGLNAEVSVLRLTEVQIWVAAAIVVAAVRWRPTDRLPIALFAASTGYLSAALLQFKGWNYHLYPARVFLAAFLVSAAATLLDLAPEIAVRLRGGMRGLGAAFGVALVATAGRYVAEARHPATADLVTPLIARIEGEAPRGPVAALSMRTLIYPAFPAVNYTGVPWSLRQNSMWFLPGLYAGQDGHGGPPLTPHAPDAMSATEREFFRQVEDDLCAAPPALLLVEEPLALAPQGRRGIDFLAYYGQSPRLARLFAHYTPDGTIGPLRSLRAAPAPACDR